MDSNLLSMLMSLDAVRQNDVPQFAGVGLPIQANNVENGNHLPNILDKLSLTGLQKLLASSDQTTTTMPPMGGIGGVYSGQLTANGLHDLYRRSYEFASRNPAGAISLIEKLTGGMNG